MNKGYLGLAATLSFVVGVVVGFAAKAIVDRKKHVVTTKEEDLEPKKEEKEEPEEIQMVEEAKDPQVMKDYQDQAAVYGAKDVTDEVNSYKEKNKGLIKVLGDSTIDPQDPDFDYGTQMEVIYFRIDDLFTDENGNPVDERILGPIRDSDIFHDDDEKDVWVRNNPKEMDIHVTKEFDDPYEALFPEKANASED